MAYGNAWQYNGSPEAIARRKAQKQKQREANKEGWKEQPENAGALWLSRNQDINKAFEDVLAPAIDGEDVSASLQKLRAIMADTKKPLYQRIGAAEIIIQYELAPGSASGSDPDQIAASSFQFLRAVADNEKTPEALLFRALKCIAQVENTRAQIKNAGASNAQKREMLTAIANAERRRGLMPKRSWPPKSGSWALDEAQWAPGWPGAWMWPPATMAANLDKPAAIEGFKKAISSAKNPAG